MCAACNCTVQAEQEAGHRQEPGTRIWELAGFDTVFSFGSVYPYWILEANACMQESPEASCLPVPLPIVPGTVLPLRTPPQDEIILCRVKGGAKT